MTGGAAKREAGHWLPDHARLIALVRDHGSDAWAAGVAVGLADMVGRERGRTFLANVAGGDDELDRLLEARGGAGLTSALTGAATIPSIARVQPEQRFTYLPAGDAALPYSGLRRMQTFRRFLARVRDGGGTLLLYVGEEDLAAAPVERAGEGTGNQKLQLDGCIALGEVRGVAAKLRAPLLARVERPVPPPAAPAAHAAHGSDAAAGASGPGPGAAAGRRPSTGAGQAPGTAAGVESSGPDRRRRAGSLTRLLIPAATLVLLWAAWTSLRSDAGPVQEGSPPDAARLDASGVERPDAAAGGPSRAALAEPVSVGKAAGFMAPAARYSVLVGSYIRLQDAMSRRAELADDGDLFYVTPTPVRGRIYYRVLAGVHEDRDDAAVAMADLVADGRKEAMKEWDIRPVRLAFHLGTFAERNSADLRMRELRAADVPAYVLRDTAQAPRYRVYAGAFTSEADAEPLRRRLAELGDGAELITRSGVAP